MKFFRQILILFFASLIFLGTVGVNVFAHYCKIDGVNYSVLVPIEDHCQKEEMKDSCCLVDTKIAKDETQYSEDCCSDQVTSFKISSELFQKDINNKFVLAQIYTFPKITQLVASIDVNPDFNYFNFRQPIPKWGRDLLIQNQLFRI